MVKSERLELISIISNLYPPDSDYHTTAEKGKALLCEAMLDMDWRELPVAVLRRMANLCIELDRAQTKNLPR